MDDFEFESKIIQNAETWISKSALFRKVGGNRNRFFRIQLVADAALCFVPIRRILSLLPPLSAATFLLTE